MHLLKDYRSQILHKIGQKFGHKIDKKIGLKNWSKIGQKIGQTNIRQTKIRQKIHHRYTYLKEAQENTRKTIWAEMARQK